MNILKPKNKLASQKKNQIQYSVRDLAILSRPFARLSGKDSPSDIIKTYGNPKDGSDKEELDSEGSQQSLTPPQAVPWSVRNQASNVPDKLQVNSLKVRKKVPSLDLKPQHQPPAKKVHSLDLPPQQPTQTQIVPALPTPQPLAPASMQLSVLTQSVPSFDRSVQPVLERSNKPSLEHSAQQTALMKKAPALSINTSRISTNKDHKNREQLATLTSGANSLRSQVEEIKQNLLELRNEMSALAKRKEDCEKLMDDIESLAEQITYQQQQEYQHQAPLYMQPQTDEQLPTGLPTTPALRPSRSVGSSNSSPRSLTEWSRPYSDEDTSLGDNEYDDYWEGRSDDQFESKRHSQSAGPTVYTSDDNNSADEGFTRRPQHCSCRSRSLHGIRNMTHYPDDRYWYRNGDYPRETYPKDELSPQNHRAQYHDRAVEAGSRLAILPKENSPSEMGIRIKLPSRRGNISSAGMDDQWLLVQNIPTGGITSHDKSVAVRPLTEEEWAGLQKEHGYEVWEASREYRQ